MATGLADARAMVAAAEQGGRFFKVFENFVFYPPVQKAKELLDEGAIGEPLTIRIKSVFGDPRHGWDIPGSAQAWRLDPARCGGGPIVFDDGHHPSMFGRPELALLSSGPTGLRPA